MAASSRTTRGVSEENWEKCLDVVAGSIVKHFLTRDTRRGMTQVVSNQRVWFSAEFLTESAKYVLLLKVFQLCEK